MLLRTATLLLLASSCSAFTTPTSSAQAAVRALAMSDSTADDSVQSAIQEMKGKLKYVPGGANTELAHRFGHLVGKPVKTVGEAFADFTRELGYTVNPLYKNMVTDIVGTTHLIVVNARFQKDPVWSLGIVTALDLLLKNYPEKDMGKRIVSSLFKSVGLDESEVRREADSIQEWASSATRQDVEAALNGEGNSKLALIAKDAKADKYWMYSRYFGIGLLKIMEDVGIEMDKDEVYPVMEDWMKNKLGKSHLTACNDSDLFFKVREKLSLMETMMKEIEIREKKRMAERLEEKAEAALRAAEKESKMQSEIEKEAARSREKVSSS